MADLRLVSRRAQRLLLRYRGVIGALLAALSVLAIIQSVEPVAPASRQVVVAAHDLDGGHALTPTDVRTVRVPPAVVPAGAVSLPGELMGRIVAAPMRAGEVITDRRLLGSALLAGYPATTVAAPVRIGDPAVVDLLQVGDRIDVYAVVSDSAAADLVVGHVRVVSLPGPDDGDRLGGLVVLAVTSAQAAALARASATAPLSVALLR